MKQFGVTGMSCAACVARVEKAVSAIDGVKKCSVSLLTNSMSVEGDVPDEQIISAVSAAGYSATLKNKAKQVPDEIGKNKKTMPVRFAVSAVLTLILMYFSMGHMLGLPTLPLLKTNYLANALLQMLLAIAVMVINQAFFISGIKGVMHKAPNMDTLVALGSAASFVYSVCIVFKMTVESSASYLHGLYFETSAMILTLITLGKMLEARSKGKTTEALSKLLSLAPKTAVVLRQGNEMRVDVADVTVGDIFVVYPGEGIPVDGTVLEGITAVNEASLTGESIPAEKTAGSRVSAGTVNTLGYIKCKATKVGEDTTLASVIRLMTEASSTKAPIARLADKVAGVFVPCVILAAILTFTVWMLTGADISTALSHGISVLVISCPCALGLATPVAIMVGSGRAAKNGILFKTAQALEISGRASVAVFDKTGTVTEGKPAVTDIICVGSNENELLQIAASVEQKSEHPLAKAIMSEVADRSILYPEVKNFKVFVGNGVSGELNGKTVVGGSVDFIKGYVDLGAELVDKCTELSHEGKTPLLFAIDSDLVGIIAVADKVKAESASAVAALKKLGIKVVMLTGDNSVTAAAVGKAVGIDDIIAGVMPDRKAAVIKELKRDGRVIMVGDGINDAPALALADVGMAIGAGTDIAIDAADVVLMNNSLTDVVNALHISKATLRNIKQNLFWAFAYNIVGIPIAAGVLVPIAGVGLSPMIGAAAMSLSSFCVVTNALRLGKIKLYKEKEVVSVKKVLKIEGMMCQHCEAHVKEALEKLPEVKSADVSHKKGKADITLLSEISDETLKNTVEALGYKVK